MDAFVDDFLAVCLQGEDLELLVSFLALMRFTGFKVSLKKLLKEAAPHHIKIILGFVMNTKDMTASLRDEWRDNFILQI